MGFFCATLGSHGSTCMLGLLCDSARGVSVNDYLFLCVRQKSHLPPPLPSWGDGGSSLDERLEMDGWKFALLWDNLEENHSRSNIHDSLLTWWFKSFLWVWTIGFLQYWTHFSLPTRHWSGRCRHSPRASFPSSPGDRWEHSENHVLWFLHCL